MRKIVVVIVSLVLAFGLLPSGAFAQDTAGAGANPAAGEETGMPEDSAPSVQALGITGATDLPFGTWVSSSMTDTVTTQTQTFQVTVPSSGKLTLDFLSSVQRIYYDFIDKDGATVRSTITVYNGSVSSPKADQMVCWLTPGTYYVQARQYATSPSGIGDYKIRASFTSANVTETEPNDTPDTANSLAVGAWSTGIISMYDGVDYYKFSLPASGKLVFSTRSFLRSITYDIIDKDGYTVLTNVANYSGSESIPQLTETVLYLVSGTYYIRANDESNAFDGAIKGKYQVMVSFTSASVTEMEPNDTPETANQAALGAWNTGILSQTDKLDYYTFTVFTSGNYSFDFRSYLYCLYYDITGPDGYTILKTVSPYSGSESAPTLSQLELRLDPGTYYVKVRKYGVTSGKYEFAVSQIVPAAVTGFRAAQTKYYVEPVKSFKIGCVYDLAAGSKKPTLTWTSSNPIFVSVDNTGKVTTGWAAGKTAKITVTSDNGMTKTFTVKIVKQATPAKGLTVLKPPKSMTAGQVKDLKVKINPAKATGVVTFSSSNKSIATVDAAGRVTAIKKGTVKITVKDGGLKKVITIKVK